MLTLTLEPHKCKKGLDMQAGVFTLTGWRTNQLELMPSLADTLTNRLERLPSVADEGTRRLELLPSLADVNYEQLPHYCMFHTRCQAAVCRLSLLRMDAVF